MTPAQVAAVVLSILGSSTAPALAALARPLYLRELRATQTEDGTVAVTLNKRGFRAYKRRTPKPTYPPPPADTEGIKYALNAALPPSLAVKAVEDLGEQIKTTILWRSLT